MPWDKTRLAFIVNPAPFHKFVTRDTKSELKRQWLKAIQEPEVLGLTSQFLRKKRAKEDSSKAK